MENLQLAEALEKTAADLELVAKCDSTKTASSSLNSTESGGSAYLSSLVDSLGI